MLRCKDVCHPPSTHTPLLSCVHWGYFSVTSHPTHWATQTEAPSSPRDPPSDINPWVRKVDAIYVPCGCVHSHVKINGRAGRRKLDIVVSNDPTSKQSELSAYNNAPQGGVCLASHGRIASRLPAVLQCQWYKRRVVCRTQAMPQAVDRACHKTRHRVRPECTVLCNRAEK
ncbi:hypothetical protein CC80DRAFT_260923 [Byssothecium circinans]|uniref:Uncharacterized protein n=1 Tax=Byssothecium circinans TaxID=147558 RepID=A0A6A5U7D8_9PLEO|nr:hypothetical protein CC80DRAFT_260923 [Byssothecium circinans]